MTKREPKHWNLEPKTELLLTMVTYDEISKLVNGACRDNPNIGRWTLATSHGLPLDVVWACLRFFKDWFRLWGDWMEALAGLLILGWCCWMFIRHPLKSLSFIFKIGFLLTLGFGVFLVLYYFALTIWEKDLYPKTGRKSVDLKRILIFWSIIAT